MKRLVLCLALGLSSSSLLGCADDSDAGGGGGGKADELGTGKATCFLDRRASIPGGEKRVQATVKFEDDAFDGSASLDAFEGSYAFDVGFSSGVISILFTENNHVQDETGSLDCGEVADLESGESFCNEPIVIDKNLGTDEEEEDMVHAFNFWCRKG